MFYKTVTAYVETVKMPAPSHNIVQDTTGHKKTIPTD